MPEISVDVAGRHYRLVCGAGEEEHLAALAGLVDREARQLGLGKGAQMPEGRLMLMSALMVADRLHDTLLRVEELEHELASTNGADPELADRIAKLAAKAERLAEPVD